MSTGVQTTRHPEAAAPVLAREGASESIVEARSVDKRYDTGKLAVHALRGVSFSVAPGEMVAIMGPSGSGKTTLLNCLSGLDGIDAGAVLIEGSALHDMSDEQRTDTRARRMGFVFQFYNLMPVLSAVENVELPLLVARVPASRARARALQALEMVGVADRAAHLPDELSGGQRQRVTIARALVNEPAIVWADEPTGDLDSENAEEIVRLMRRLNREQGLTFLIVTHDIAIGRATDRIVRMTDGQIVDEELLEVRAGRPGARPEPPADNGAPPEDGAQPEVRAGQPGARPEPPAGNGAPLEDRAQPEVRAGRPGARPEPPAGNGAPPGDGAKPMEVENGRARHAR
jgi:ABC-type lipoprotein export system ATPase subunit